MGSIKINLNFVCGSQGLQSQLQSIKGQLDTIQSTRQVTQLIRELNQTSTALRDMKEKAQNVFGQSQQDYFGGLEDEIIHIYGRIEDALVLRKISQIQHEAESLKDSMAHGDPVDTKAVNTLKRHIFDFLKDYRPALKDRQVINDARQVLKEADLTLKGKIPDEKPIAHFEWLVQQSDVRLIEDEDIELEPGQYEDLFDIAAMVYNGKMREAKATYNQLPENLKRIFHLHIRELRAVAFNDEVETIKALLGTANQLVNNREPYPTRTQIDEIFMGLRNVTAEEEKSPIRYSIRKIT